MSNRQIIIVALIMLAGYFLYEPVMDRYFSDTSLKVAEAATPFPDNEQELRIETARLALSLSPHGGRITSARLKEFTTKQDQPVELIAGLLKTRAGIRLDLPEFFEDPDDLPYDYQVNGEGVVFSRELPGQLEIIKSYQPAGEYGITMELTLINRGDAPIALPAGYRITPFFGMAPGDDDEAKDLQVAWLNGPEDRVQRRKTKEVREPFQPDQPVNWVGIRNRYFTQVLIPASTGHTITLQPLGGWQLYPTLSTPALTLAPGASQQDSYHLYLGPLTTESLRADHAGLDRMMDYGSFEILGRAGLGLLKFIRQYVANYGLCLILLALLLRLLLFPVSQYNLKALRAMPQLQHEIYRLEDEETADAAELLPDLRKQLRKAMVGSFLPLAIQIPIFLALYQVLNGAIELRQAALGLWITDLSVQDPYFVLPVLMGLAMIGQQYLTTVNPHEDKTWIWMPLGFALFFAFFPAGLVLFWLADSLFAVAQLALIKRKTATERIPTTC